MTAPGGFEPLQTMEFGGWNTFYENVQLIPPPFSPLAYNVQFRRGGVRTRPGFTARGEIGVPTKILSIADYVLTNTTQRRLLFLLDNGYLVKVPGAYESPVTIASDLFDAASGPYLQMLSQTAFGRQYIGIAKTVGDVPGAGYHVPMAYNDTFLDPVAPAGPAYAPIVAEGPAGAFPESIAAGTHYYRVCYRTRNGYITPPGPLAVHVSDGGKQVTITSIAPGPDYVTGRIIVATPTNNPGDYFFVPGKMEIGDNTTETISFEFTDPELINGTAISVRSDPGSDMLNCINLDEQAGCIFYHGRLGWYGGRASLRSVGDSWPKNLAFDGGFRNTEAIIPSDAGTPAGWRGLLANSGAGFSPGGPAGKVGQGLTITGDGVHASIMQAIRTLTPDSTFNLLSFPAGKDIRVRARCRKSANAGTTAQVLLYILPDGSAIDAHPAQFTEISTADMSADEWRWVEVTFLLASQTLLPGFAHSYVNIATTGPETNGGDLLPAGEQIFIDRIEFFLDGTEYEPDAIRWSRPNQPDAYDDAIGVQYFGRGDGQRIVGGFSDGDNCYVIKEHSIYVTRDDGQNEPGFWNTSVVSATKGTEGSRGYDIGDHWAVIASRSGLQFFDGSTPHTISMDIFRTWERINWAAADRVFVVIDADNNRLFVGVPLDDETEAKHLLTLEYLGVGTPDASLKWSEWALLDGTLSAGVVYHRPDGIRDVLFVAKNDTADLWNVLAIDETAHRDSCVGVGSNPAIAINSRYRMPYGPEDDGRHSWGHLTANVWGAGELKIVGYMPDNLTLVTEGNRGCNPVDLNAEPIGDMEWIIDVTSERLSWELRTEALDSWFALNKFVQYFKQKPFSSLRGQRKPV